MCILNTISQNMLPLYEANEILMSRNNLKLEMHTQCHESIMMRHVLSSKRLFIQDVCFRIIGNHKYVIVGETV